MFIVKFAKNLVNTDSNKGNTPNEESKITNNKKSKSNEQELVYNRCNLTTIYNKAEDYKPISATSVDEKLKEEKLIVKFKQIIEDQAIIDMNKLQELAWNGIPGKYRSLSWKLLLKYVPPKKENQHSVLQRKREEYLDFVSLYFHGIKEEDRDEADKKIMKIIIADVNRTYPDSSLFRLESIQNIMIRLLFTWHTRHPACGYVQGMNDIVSTFIAAFIADYVDINYETFSTPLNIEKYLTEQAIKDIEADAYWCLSKILDGVMDNYTNSHVGLDKAINKIKEIIKKIDIDLYNHFEKEEVMFFQVGVRWVYCLLVREFPLKLALRLFDTFISDEKGFNVLHVYVCAALLLKWSVKLKKLKFSDIMLFLQQLPTQDWKEEDLNIILAESYVYRSLYEDSPGHLTNSQILSPYGKQAFIIKGANSKKKQWESKEKQGKKRKKRGKNEKKRKKRKKKEKKREKTS